MQYRALSTIKNGLQRIEPGQLLDLDESTAREFIQQGLVEPYHQPFAGKLVMPNERTPS